MLKNKLLAVAISLVFCMVFSTEAFAWQGRSQNGSEASRHNEVQHGMAGHGGDSHGEMHRDGWFWGGVALSALAVGAIIASLPQQHETAYAYSTSAVAEPVMFAQTSATSGIQTQRSSPGSVEINVPNARGGYTPVVLTRCEGGYVGPQGEYYSVNPTLEQLKALYGV
jgi:hypothetical protein